MKFYIIIICLFISACSNTKNITYTNASTGEKLVVENVTITEMMAAQLYSSVVVGPIIRAYFADRGTIPNSIEELKLFLTDNNIESLPNELCSIDTYRKGERVNVSMSFMYPIIMGDYMIGKDKTGCSSLIPSSVALTEEEFKREKAVAEKNSNIDRDKVIKEIFDDIF
jgi:hypothetical protein